MTEKQLARATERYNDLMWGMAYEHNTIGTSLSESTEGWNLRDMVSEVQYTLDTWLDPECTPYQDAHDRWMDADEREYLYNDWVKYCRRMKRFINAYKDEALKMTCTNRHCSKFD